MLNLRWFADSTIDEQFDDLYELGNVKGKSGVPWTEHWCRSKKTTHQCQVKILSKKEKQRCPKYMDRLGRLFVVDYPHLTRLLEVLESATDVYAVSESVDGAIELFDMLANRDRYTELEIAKCIRQVLEAIQYLHGREIIHGNLKPESLLCRELENKELDVIVADYGLETVFGRTCMLATNTIVATDFCAPETLKGAKLTPSVDIWAVGVIAYILLCGHEPYRTDMEAEKFKMIFRGELVFDPYDWEETTEICKDFVRRLMAFDPKARPTASEALRHRWLNGAAPNLGHREATTYRLKLYTNRRHVKLSNEASPPFTAKMLADNYPQSFRSLDHLADRPSTPLVIVSAVPTSIDLPAVDDVPSRKPSACGLAILGADPFDRPARWVRPNVADDSDEASPTALHVGSDHVDLGVGDHPDFAPNLLFGQLGASFAVTGAPSLMLDHLGAPFSVTGARLPWTLPSTGDIGVVGSSELETMGSVGGIFPRQGSAFWPDGDVGVDDFEVEPLHSVGRLDDGTELDGSLSPLPPLEHVSI